MTNILSFLVKLLLVLLILFQISCKKSIESQSNNSNLINDTDFSTKNDLSYKDKEFGEIPKNIQLVKTPYQIKKLRVLAKDDVSPWYKEYKLDLKIDQLAKNVDEVGTVALLDYKKNKFGTYKDSFDLDNKKDTVLGFYWTCELTLIDYTIPAVIYKKSFKGDKPSESVLVNKGVQSIDGPKPDKAITGFLISLQSK